MDLVQQYAIALSLVSLFCWFMEIYGPPRHPMVPTLIRAVLVGMWSALLGATVYC